MERVGFTAGTAIALSWEARGSDTSLTPAGMRSGWAVKVTWSSQRIAAPATGSQGAAASAAAAGAAGRWWQLSSKLNTDKIKQKCDP